jgi:hypothetical protein
MQKIETVRLTRKEYMELSGDSPQSVWNKIDRGTLKLVKCRELAEVEKIELTPEEYDTLRARTQP